MNEDLKRTNDELKRQLDKWQNLETKGEVHAEDLRKSRTELEMITKELENKLVESEKKSAEAEKAREKEARRVEKAKAAYVEWKVLLERSIIITNTHFKIPGGRRECSGRCRAS